MDQFNENEYPLPEWAISKSDGKYLEMGAQLRTRDGRRCGNAFVNNLRTHPVFKVFADIVTDAGTSISLTESELKEMFYPPAYVMNVNEARKKFCRGYK